jgi:hypothetical protein
MKSAMKSFDNNPWLDLKNYSQVFKLDSDSSVDLVIPTSLIVQIIVENHLGIREVGS